MIEQCRLCGGEDLRLYFRDGYQGQSKYYRCGDCKLLNYDLELGLDQAQYTETYVSPTVPDYKPNVDGTASWEYLRQFVSPPGRLMDIGCGNGRLLWLAKADGWDVRGLELSTEAAAAVEAEQDVPVIVANFLDYEPDDAGTYDVVILRHVLEHLPDPLAAMARIRALLKPGGHALLEFPNIHSVSYQIKRLMRNRGMRNAKFSPEWRPGHANEYCRESFGVLAGKSGFEIVDWRTYSGNPLHDAIYAVLPFGGKVRALVRRT